MKKRWKSAAGLWAKRTGRWPRFSCFSPSCTGFKRISPRLARQARDVFAAGEGPDHPFTAHALLEIGRSYLDQSRLAEAETPLRRCLEIRQKNLDARHPDLAKARFWLGKCLIEQGRYDEATVLLREAQATFDAVYGPASKPSRDAAKLLETSESARGRTGPVTDFSPR